MNCYKNIGKRNNEKIKEKNKKPVKKKMAPVKKISC